MNPIWQNPPAFQGGHMGQSRFYRVETKSIYTKGSTPCTTCIYSTSFRLQTFASFCWLGFESTREDSRNQRTKWDDQFWMSFSISRQPPEPSGTLAAIWAETPRLSAVAEKGISAVLELSDIHRCLSKLDQYLYQIKLRVCPKMIQTPKSIKSRTSGTL